MNILCKVGVLLLSMILFSCGSSPVKEKFQYGFRAGEVQYQLMPVKLTLLHGHGAPEDSSLFASEEEVRSSIQQLISEKMSENSLLATDSDYSVEFDIQYERRYNWGGKALNKPYISYVANIYREGSLLRSLSYGQFTTKYAYLKNIAVDAEIAAFKWGAEDEPKDLEVVAGAIATDLSKVGD